MLLKLLGLWQLIGKLVFYNFNTKRVVANVTLEGILLALRILGHGLPLLVTDRCYHALYDPYYRGAVLLKY